MPSTSARSLPALALAGIALSLGQPPRAWAATAAGAAPPSAPPAEAFDIWEIRVLGNSVLKNIDVERAVYSSLGPQREFKDLERARDALATVYRDHGYGAVFVDIPEQQVKNGLVRLQVTEGRVDRVHVSGSRYFSNGNIRSAVTALQQGQVLNTGALSSEVAKLNSETPDRTVVPVLRAGRTPGTVDVDLKVNDHLPVHATLDVNNRYTANTSPTRVGINVSYDNLFQARHSLSLQYQTAPADSKETRVFAATYLVPLAGLDRMAVYVVDTNSATAAVGTLGVLGAGQIYGARYIAPLPGSATYTQSFTFGPDYKDFKQTIQLENGTDLTPIHYVLWTANYSANLRTPNTLTSFTLAPSIGLRGLVNDSEEFAYARYNAKPDFSYLRASFQHERPLLLGSRLYLRAATQLTNEPLVNNEQLALGGIDTVRGYLEADVLGDLGVSGAVEWRLPVFSPLFGSRWSKSHLFSFFDAGYVRTLDPLPSQVGRTNLSSWGVGLRVVDLGGFQGVLNYARPLKPTVTTPAGDSRVNFDFSYGL